jgi:hypothetical protein
MTVRLLQAPLVSATLLVIAAGFCPRVRALQPGFFPENRTVIDVAEELAPRIAATLREEQAKRNRTLEVAVFSFGDARGRVSENLAFAAKALQGELSSQLRNHADRKFVVWDPNRLAEKVRESHADVKLLTVKNFEVAGDELEKIGLDAAVVGSYRTNEGDQHFGEPVNVHVDVLFSDGPPQQAASKVQELDPNQMVLHPEISTRLSVDILVDGRPLPMYVEAGHGGKLLVELDQQRHYGKEFTIRLTNHGMPPVGWLARSEKRERTRFYTAAVFVDGVNSIYEKEADGQFHPSQRHPDKVTKWVLAAPGMRVRPGYDTLRNPRAVQYVRGAGGAELEIPGFQLNNETAAAFEFADAGESVANEVGLTKEIGMINVYFYAERLKEDEIYFGPGVAAAMPGGVKQGRPIPQRVYRVTVHTHPKPVEVWSILYRYTGSDDSVAARRRKGEQIIGLEEAEQRMKERCREAVRMMGDPFEQRSDAQEGAPRGRRGRRRFFGSPGPG